MAQNNENQRTMEGPNMSPSAVPRRLELGSAGNPILIDQEVNLAPPTVQRRISSAQHSCESECFHAAAVYVASAYAILRYSKSATSPHADMLDQLHQSRAQVRRLILQIRELEDRNEALRATLSEIVAIITRFG